MPLMKAAASAHGIHDLLVIHHPGMPLCADTTARRVWAWYMATGCRVAAIANPNDHAMLALPLSLINRCFMERDDDAWTAWWGASHSHHVVCLHGHHEIIMPRARALVHAQSLALSP
jgi:hypothetical protein